MGFYFGFGKNQDHSLNGYVNYSHYKYPNELVFPEFIVNGFSGETVVFKDIGTLLEYAWKVNPKLQLYTSSYFYNRGSNDKST